jgi:V/A-type H+/Na+-transporting ATPase subunit D
MSLALNKSSLKQQRDQLKMFRRFLPSLDLKRQQLLAALKEARRELAAVQQEVEGLNDELKDLLPLLGSSTIGTRDLTSLVSIRSVRIEEQNVLGTQLPVAREVDFDVKDYSTLVTPFWVDLLVDKVEQLAELQVHFQVREERVKRLDYAARKITQRVNLFEKVLIPQARENIRRIVIFLSDQERAAVVRSKIAKKKNAAASMERAG